MSDSTSALLRGLRTSATFGTFRNFTLEKAHSRDWASATFSGARHAITFRLEGEDAEARADAFLGGLEEREFNLRGHILADIRLVAQTRTRGSEGPLVRIALEALTVEDC